MTEIKTKPSYSAFPVKVGIISYCEPTVDESIVIVTNLLSFLLNKGK